MVGPGLNWSHRYTSHSGCLNAIEIIRSRLFLEKSDEITRFCSWNSMKSPFVLHTDPIIYQANDAMDHFFWTHQFRRRRRKRKRWQSQRSAFAWASPAWCSGHWPDHGAFRKVMVSPKNYPVVMYDHIYIYIIWSWLNDLVLKALLWLGVALF